MTHQDRLKRALTRLLHDWLANGRAQVAQYLANNGRAGGNPHPDPADVAAACPLCFNSPAVAAHHLQTLQAAERPEAP